MDSLDLDVYENWLFSAVLWKTTLRLVDTCDQIEKIASPCLVSAALFLVVNVPQLLSRWMLIGVGLTRSACRSIATALTPSSCRVSACSSRVTSFVTQVTNFVSMSTVPVLVIFSPTAVAHLWNIALLPFLPSPNSTQFLLSLLLMLGVFPWLFPLARKFIS